MDLFLLHLNDTEYEGEEREVIQLFACKSRVPAVQKCFAEESAQTLTLIGFMSHSGCCKMFWALIQTENVEALRR